MKFTKNQINELESILRQVRNTKSNYEAQYNAGSWAFWEKHVERDLETNIYQLEALIYFIQFLKGYKRDFHEHFES